MPPKISVGTTETRPTITINVEKTFSKVKIKDVKAFLFTVYQAIDDVHKIPIAKAIYVAASLGDRFEQVKLLTYLLTVHFGRSIIATVSTDAWHWSSLPPVVSFASVKFNGVWYCFWIHGKPGEFVLYDHNPEWKNEWLVLEEHKTT